jgi:hypothetical protein
MQRNSVTNLEEKPVPTSGYIIFGILLAAQGLAFLSTVLLGFQSNKLPINDIFLSIALSNILLLPISAGEYFHRPLRPNNSGMAAVSGVCAVAGMLCCFISSVWIDPSTFAFIFSLALLFFYMSIDAIRSQSYYRASFYHRGIGTTIAVLAICGFQLSEMLLEFRPLIMWATVVSVLVFVVVRAIRTVRFRRRLVLLSIVRFGKFLGLGGDMVTRNFVLMGLGLFSAELEAVFLRLMQQASGAIGSVLGNINYVYNVKMVREQERGQQRIWSIFRSVIRRNSLITLV